MTAALPVDIAGKTVSSSMTAWPPFQHAGRDASASRGGARRDRDRGARGPESTSREFAGLVDDVVCASMPTRFLAV